MEKKDAIEVEGKVVELLPGSMFRIELENGQRVLANISGELRLSLIRFNLGDRVTLEMSPFDLNKGRITARHEENSNTPQTINIP